MSFWRRRRDLQSTCWLRRWACIDGRQPSSEGCKRSLRCRASEFLLRLTKKHLAVSFWRRRRDLNPRALLQAYSLSRGAPSTTWVLLHILIDFAQFLFFHICRLFEGATLRKQGKRGEELPVAKADEPTFRAAHTSWDQKEQIVLVRVRQRSWPSTTWVLLHIKCFAILTHKRGGVNYFLSLKQKI